MLRVGDRMADAHGLVVHARLVQRLGIVDAVVIDALMMLDDLFVGVGSCPKFLYDRDIRDAL